MRVHAARKAVVSLPPRRSGRDRPARLLAYTDAQEFAGAEHGLATLLGALSSNVEPTLLGTNREVVEAIAASRPGMRARVVPPVRNKLDLGPIRDHVNAVRELAPDLFQVNLRTSWSCQYGSLAALLYGKARLIGYEHAPLPAATAVQRWQSRKLARRFAAHVAASAFAARLAEGNAGLPYGAVEVIRYGVEDEGATLDSRSNGSSRRLLAVGRLCAEKGFDVLLRALSDLPDVTLQLVGDGPDRRMLAGLAASLGVSDRVAFAGWQTDVRHRLGQFDAMVVPSRFEAFGIGIVEAMLASRPVVATRVGGIPEVVVDGVTALLVPPDDPGALAQAIRRLVDSPGLRARLGREGRAHALRTCSPEAAADAFETLYERVLADPAARTASPAFRVAR